MPRDWIPDGVPVRLPNRDEVVDFVPAGEPKPALSFAEREASFAAASARALEASNRRQATAIFDEWEAAKRRLEGLTVGSFVSAWDSLTLRDREVLVLAEEAGQNRRGIVDKYANQVRPATRRQFAHLLNPEGDN